MLNQIIRYFNQNKKKIIIGVAVIAFLIILLTIINSAIKQNRQKENKDPNDYAVTDLEKPNESIISDVNLSEETAKINSEIIKSFVEACNNKNYEQAYNLLSTECKEVEYSTLQDFQNDYIKHIMENSVSYQLELWNVYDGYITYRVTFYEGNLLQNGGIPPEENYVDYITLLQEENKIKLNINKFVKREEINKSAKDRDIEIIINARNVYMDYEIYNITFKNYSEKSILINDGQDSNNIFITDQNGNQYISYINEIPLASLGLKPGFQKLLNVKFAKAYNTYREVRYITFQNIILDSELYNSNPNDVERLNFRIPI